MKKIELYIKPHSSKPRGEQTHKRFAYVARIETVNRVKEYAAENHMSIKETMELLLNKGLEAVN